MASAVSKHRRYTSDGDWIPGKLIVRNNSSLRKLMRAARREKMPDERQVVIDMAIEKSAKRRALYLNSCPWKRATRSKMEASRWTKPPAA